MLIISESQFLAELSKSKSNTKELESEIKTEIVLENNTYDNFRKPKLPNIPKEVKSIIGALATSESYEDVSQTFKVSKDTIGNLVNDKHSNPEVSERKANILEAIKSKTAVKIDLCIDFLSISKEAGNKELLYTAESLSRIHRNISPVTAPAEGANVQFIFYAPEKLNKVTDYDVIDA